VIDEYKGPHHAFSSKGKQSTDQKAANIPASLLDNHASVGHPRRLFAIEFAGSAVRTVGKEKPLYQISYYGSEKHENDDLLHKYKVTKELGKR
jgi:hypothetical protein